MMTLTGNLTSRVTKPVILTIVYVIFQFKYSSNGIEYYSSAMLYKSTENIARNKKLGKKERRERSI